MTNPGTNIYLPGSTIGVLGGGQLGRMMALAGKAMGYRFAVLDPTPDSPLGQLTDVEVVAPYDDVAAARQLADASHLITYEFENVDAAVASVLEESSDVPQGSRLLYTTQHRLREKHALLCAGVPVAPFQAVSSSQDLLAATSELGYPAVLKTTMGGYDGKGQLLLQSPADLALAHTTFTQWLTSPGGRALDAAAESTPEPAQRPAGISNQAASSATRSASAASETVVTDAPLVLEAFVPFVQEISVVVARSRRGEVRTFPVAENIHHHHILHLSIAPARISEEVREHAEAIARQVASGLDVIGLIAIEMFVLANGTIYVNELAPRPHNSGHYTMDACVTSQFEQHVRAICNLPLGDTRLLTPVVMVNILGEHVDAVHSLLPHMPANFKLHLYGKAESRTGRKMGHINVLAENVDEALAQIAKTGIWAH